MVQLVGLVACGLAAVMPQGADAFFLWKFRGFHPPPPPPCGGPGQFCCPPNNPAPCGPNLGCNGPIGNGGRCQPPPPPPCGLVGGPCCNGGQCSEGGCVQGICAVPVVNDKCGWFNEACCAEGCFQGSCMGGTCTEAKSACGWLNEECCANSKCFEEQGVCNDKNQCVQDCGWEGDFCCKDETPTVNGCGEGFCCNNFGRCTKLADPANGPASNQAAPNQGG